MTRETFGNIPHSSQILFYILITLSVGVFFYGVWRRFKLWKQGVSVGLRELFRGAATSIWSRIKPKVVRVGKEALGQKRVWGRGLPSLAHGWLFYGFIALLIGTTLLEIDNIAGMISKNLHFHKGLYYVIYEMTLDIMGVLFILGCVLFAIRRIKRPPSVGHSTTDWAVLAMLIGLGVTGFILEGLRMGWQKPVGWGAWCSPVGLMISGAFTTWSERAIRDAHLAIWWLHSFMVMGFFAMIPFTRLFHFVSGTLNLFLAPGQLGRMEPVAMEKVEETGQIGVSEILHFNQQQLLSLDACMECGRCEEACPAYATRKPLSPKMVVQDLKGLLTKMARRREGEELPALHGEVIKAETLWSCTSCSACTNVCPVRVDPLGLIFDMRRNRVGEGTLSGTPATALRRMQSSANPWGLPAADRPNWAEGLEAPLARDHASFEVLYWVGCAGSYDRRAQRVARAVVKLLKHAGVNFAILGREEKCTGESARRLGDEFLFQELATANIATLGKYKVRKILAHCPHCLNTFLKDYPQFGGQYEVVHHSEFIAQLVKEGKLKPAENKSTADAGPVTYHDPCYLARVNGIHEAPREVLLTALNTGSKIPDFREMEKRRTKTFCCGAGGGRMWMEEPPQQRVSTVRAGEALATGAKTVAVGCPFCLTMMTDGVAAQGAEARVADLAELLVERLGI